MKIGIFGGSFNPPHNGHVNSLTTVQKKMGFDKIHIIPNSQNPLKVPTETPADEHRLAMAKLAFSTYGPAFHIDDRELKRGGKSYTIDTIKELRKEYDSKNLYLIIGADNFEQLSEWKDYKKILEEVNLVVTTRPGYQIPETESEFPDYLSGLVAESDFGAVELTTGRSIEFLTLQDLDIASSELRKKLRVGRPVEKFLPLSVESYIKEHGIYRVANKKISNYAKFTEFCAQVLFDKKAIAVRGFDIREISTTTDYTLIASGTSTRHAASIAENLIAAVKEEFNVYPQGVEGVDEGRWVVVDYLKKITNDDYVFLFDEGGKDFDSIFFSKQIEASMMSGKKRMVFVIGGAFGVSDEVKSRAQVKVSLSKMVMNHLVAETVALEQIYRGFTIIKRIPYHNI